MEKSKTKNELSKTIKSIFDAIINNQEKENESIVNNIIKNNDSLKIDLLNNPENFSCFISHKMNNILSYLVNQNNLNVNHITLSNNNKNKYAFVFTQYNFLANNIEHLCSLREKGGCDCDKSRYIIDMYLQFIISDNIPETKKEKDNYWIPNFGNNKEWIEFCDSLYDLFYGYPEKYFAIYKKLLTCKIRKYKHTLHHWFIEMKTGDKIEYAQTWDTDIKNPLDNDIYNKENCYLVLKKYCKNKKFAEINNSERNMYELLNSYYKIPKTDIDKIYKESEEVLV